MKPVRLLIVPGSMRAGSLNRRLAACALRAATAAGAVADEFDLRELRLPLYDGDLEAAGGVPDGGERLRQSIEVSDALLIVTPEYNGFPTPLVINAFDWLSRLPARDGRRSGLATTANKPAALLAASPGPLGGLRSMNFLRQYLQMAFAMIVVPQQFALGKANEAFDDEGLLADAKSQQALSNVLAALFALVTALKAAPQPAAAA
jgi:chromate reductase, NAD(P)H dehydrogenase (quinone)